MGITIDFPHSPTVRFSRKAWADLFYVTDHVTTEVAMFGIVTRLAEYQFYVEKVYLPHQQVHSTTAEIEPDDLVAFVEELLTYPNGLEEYERLRLWAHSHANMGLTASGQDDKTLEWLASATPEPFIAVRTNRKGEITADILYPNGLKLNDVPCEQDPLIEFDLSGWDGIIKERVRRISGVTKPWKAETPAASAKPWRKNDNYYDYVYGDWPGTQGYRDQFNPAALAAADGTLGDDDEVVEYETYNDWLVYYGFVGSIAAAKLGVTPDEWAAAESALRTVWDQMLTDESCGGR